MSGRKPSDGQHPSEELLDAAEQSTALLASILDSLPPGTPLDQALAATLIAFIVMAHEAGLSVDEAIEQVRAHWLSGSRVRDGIMEVAKRAGDHDVHG